MLPGSTRRRPATPGNRRRHLRVDQLQLGVVDRGRVLLDRRLVLRDQRGLRIQLLFGHRVGLEQLLVALEVDLRVVEQRLVLRQRGLRRLELHLVRPRIDLGQHLARLDEVAFLKVDLHQLAVDARLDRHRVERGHVAEALQIDGNAGPPDGGDDDRHRSDAQPPPPPRPPPPPPPPPPCARCADAGWPARQTA